MGVSKADYVQALLTSYYKRMSCKHWTKRSSATHFINLSVCQESKVLWKL